MLRRLPDRRPRHHFQHARCRCRSLFPAVAFSADPRRRAAAKYWRAYKLALNPVWSVDHLLARDDEVVSEWSCIWTPRRTDKRLMLRGSEWYVMRDGKIAEIRAYFMSADDAHCELAGFPYGERGYLGMAADLATASAVRRAG
jgi:hypothetical protein